MIIKPIKRLPDGWLYFTAKNTLSYGFWCHKEQRKLIEFTNGKLRKCTYSDSDWRHLHKESWYTQMNDREVMFNKIPLPTEF